MAAPEAMPASLQAALATGGVTHVVAGVDAPQSTGRGVAATAAAIDTAIAVQRRHDRSKFDDIDYGTDSDEEREREREEALERAAKRSPEEQKASKSAFTEAFKNLRAAARRPSPLSPDIGRGRFRPKVDVGDARRGGALERRRFWKAPPRRAPRRVDRYKHKYPDLAPEGVEDETPKPKKDPFENGAGCAACGEACWVKKHCGRCRSVMRGAAREPIRHL